MHDLHPFFKSFLGQTPTPNASHLQVDSTWDLKKKNITKRYISGTYI